MNELEKVEIAVVGGGPIGCFIAEHLAVKKRQIVVFEEHETIGEPAHCAGLVTQRVLDITKCPKDEIVENEIYGAVIHSPSNALLTIGGEKRHALVMNRQKFDNFLAEKAQNAEATILRKHKIIGVKQHASGFTLSVQQDSGIKHVRCSLLIGADGSHSYLREHLGFPTPIEKLHGISAEVIDVTLDPKYVHIFLGNTIAPGFFAWIIPTNRNGTHARIGLCIDGLHHSHSLQHYFSTLLQQPLLQGTTVVKKFGGTIPLGPLKITAADHLMLVGDAAAQVKPTSGGGIYPGLRCAQHCCTVAETAFEKKRFDADVLQEYHTTWMKDIGRELFLGMRFRNIFTHLTDTQFDKYLKKFNTQKILDVINTYGDIDFPSRLTLPLLKTAPSLLSLAPTLLKRKKERR
jgi:digeranylgeranylglycerophospholipid reductase